MIDVPIKGLNELLKKMDGMKAKARKLQPAFRIVAELLELHVANRQFETEGAAGGAPWSGLSRRTVIARASRYGYYRRSPRGASATGPILQWTQSMRRSFMKGKRHHIQRITAKTMRWGSSHPFVDFHQKGKGRRKREMIRFANDFQRNTIVAKPFEMYLMGIPEGTIRTILKARTR